MTERIPSGRIGEEIAALFLRLKGYQVVHRNLRTRTTELDLVATKGDCVVFVEVKLRGRGSISQPIECLDATKRRRLAKGALLFLQRCPSLSSRTVRFDVVAITCTGERLIADHVESAFTAEGVTSW